MPEAPIYQLSQELVDTIVDDLAELLKDWPFDRWEDLSNCSLVCKSFLPRSQYHLFYRIKIKSAGHVDHELCTERCEELGQILMQSPHIATYIQELRLEVQSDDNIWIHRNPSFLVTERLRILRRDPAITLSTDFNVVYRDASCIR
jgi:hypothetical protein